MAFHRMTVTLRVASGVLLLGSLAGCGTSQYETLLAKEIKEIRAGAPWARFWSYSTLPNTPVKVRIPEIFTNSYQLNSPHVSDGDRINANRAQPPFLKLPGFRLVFEDFYSEGSTRAPYYCYLAADKATPQQVQALSADLLKKLLAAFPLPDAKEYKWDDVDCKTPEGGTMTWKRVTVTGEQAFDIDAGPSGGIQSRNMQATFDLWLYEGQGYYVLIGWRINSEWDKKQIHLDTLAPLTAGTVQIGEAAAAPAP